MRFIPSIANVLYGDDGETLYVHQFMESETEIDRDGKKLTVKQETDYPRDGRVKLTFGADTKVAVRIPGWYKGYKGETKLGYAYFDVKAGESLEFDFEMAPRAVSSNAGVFYNLGRCAIMRGHRGLLLRVLRQRQGASRYHPRPFEENRGLRRVFLRYAHPLRIG